MANKRAGRKGAAKTPAPKKERISGSKTNKSGSASASSRKSIKFSEGLTKKLSAFLKEYNKANSSKKISLPTAKKVVRRGMGAYSSTHRPTIREGDPIAVKHGELRDFTHLQEKSLEAPPRRA